MTSALLSSEGTQMNVIRAVLAVVIGLIVYFGRK